MTFYYIEYIVVLILCFIPSLFPKPWRRVMIIYCLSIASLILVGAAGVRAATVDPDYSIYLEWFAHIKRGSLEGVALLKDPAFIAISYAVSYLQGEYILVASIFAVLALSMKLLVGCYASPLKLLPLFVYLEFCRFYLAQDMTSVRAAVAIPLMTLAIFAALRKRRGLGWCLFIIAATFHASVALASPVLIAGTFGKAISRKIFIYTAIVAVAFSVLFRNAIIYLSNLSRISDYLNGAYEVSGLRLLSIYFVFRFLVGAFIILHLWTRIRDEDRFVVFASSVGLAFQIVLASNDALALRSSEVFGIFDVLMFLIPMKCLHQYTRVAYAGVLLLMGLLFFNSSVRIMNPYQTVWSYLRPRTAVLASMASVVSQADNLLLSAV